MTRKLNITICGGGNLAHAQAAYLARKGYEVNIYTRRPCEWNTTLEASFFEGKTDNVHLKHVTDCPSIVQNSDVVLISLPRFAVEEVALLILPYLTNQHLVVLSPGAPWLQDVQKDFRWIGKKICGLYKVPFISRTEKYGQKVSVLGSRDINRVWLSEASLRTYIPLIEDMFDTPLVELSSSWPFVLTNSNPLLHPSRLVELFKNYASDIYYDHNFLFYEEWTTASSELYIAADKELLKICELCPGMTLGKDIVPVTEYYESPDAEALTHKIRSISAFKGIRSPMSQQKHGWVPDFSSRYFTEDVEWGTSLICEYARSLRVNTPVLDHFVSWTRDMLSRYGNC